MPPIQIPDMIACLDSPVLGALCHTIWAVGSALWPDVVAVRVYGLPDEARTSLVDARRLGLSSAWEGSLQAWPTSIGSIFDWAQQLNWRDRLARPSQWLDPVRIDPARLYRPIDVHTQVRDTVCASFSLDSARWCLVALLRCGKSPGFAKEHLDALRQSLPTMARVVRNGVRLHLNEDKPAAALATKTVVPTGLPMRRIMLKLSKTERAILDHLRLKLTEAQTAQRLGRSRHTVHVHVRSIYRKFNVNSRGQLFLLLGD